MQHFAESALDVPYLKSRGNDPRQNEATTCCGVGFYARRAVGFPGCPMNQRGTRHPTVMEVYKRETRQVIRRFLLHQLGFPNCISALDAALAFLIPGIHPEELDTLRAVMLANNETVMKEMERRAAAPLVPWPLVTSA